MSNGTNHNTSGTVSPSDHTEAGNQSCLASSNSLFRFLAGESIENILESSVLHYPGSVNADQIH